MAAAGAATAPAASTTGTGTGTGTTAAPGTAGSGTAGKAPRRAAATFTLIEHGPLRFLITDCPDERSIATYIDSVKEYKVAHLVRACETTYSAAALAKAGIQVHEFAFEDGSPPPAEVLKRWLDLIERLFVDAKSPDFLGEGERLAVHCVAGLGRAPVLVTVALIEAGMDPLEAAQFVRERRKGALNTAQLRWLETYHRCRASRWRGLLASGAAGKKCLVM